MNVLDRVYAVISPETALRREHARQKLNLINSGYSHHGASRTKKSLLGWLSSGGSPKEDISDNLELLRQRSRDLYMGAPIATGALKTVRTNVVGSGLKLKAQIDSNHLEMSDEEADEWEETVEREFSLWADSVNCDAQRLNNFYELQQLTFLSWLMSGDCFALLPIIPRTNMPYDLRIHLIEADRVCTPIDKLNPTNIISGVEFGTNGEIEAYYVSKKHPLTSSNYRNEWVRVEAFGKKTGRPNVLHLMESERPEQYRGVPILAPVIESLKQLSRYSEAELMAAVVSGMYTVFIKTNSDNENPLGQSYSENDRVDDKDENSYELGNGAIIALGEGESIEQANPGRPNTAFDGFVTAICRQIGSALEIPYELLIKHFTASYSASRAALLEASKMFKMRRSWLAADFCQPIYEEWLAEAVAKGRVKAPGFFNDPLIRKSYSGAKWNGPSQGQIDPLKEVKAANERVNSGFSTRSDETIELTGGNWMRNHRQRVKEERMRREGGLIIDESKNQEGFGIQESTDKD